MAYLSPGKFIPKMKKKGQKGNKLNTPDNLKPACEKGRNQALCEFLQSHVLLNLD